MNIILLATLAFLPLCSFPMTVSSFLHVIGKQGKAETNCKELENVPQQISWQF